VRLSGHPKNKRVPRCAVALIAIVAIAISGTRAGAQTVPPQTLRSAAAIVGMRGGQRTMLGSAFFIEVPSKRFPGSSFVYLVTAHHVLLDSDGAPIPKLWVVLEDARSGVSREDPLPDERHWLLDLKHESADIAALPFGPPTANIAPIPLGDLFATASEAKVGEMPDSIDAGAPCYYLTAASLGAQHPRFVPLARFCRVSVAEAAEATVTGAGNQVLYFVDAPATSGLRGAPVFVNTGDHYVLFGMMEPQAQASLDSALAGLAGVMPADYIAETVEALAAAQEKKSKSKSSIGN
jgi:hypothetical protein